MVVHTSINVQDVVSLELYADSIYSNYKQKYARKFTLSSCNNERAKFIKDV